MSSSKFENWRIIRLSQQLNNHMRLYGYRSIDLPIIETADLFLIKAGDQIVNRLFTFERHGQQLALRPEFTAAAAYHYMTEYGDNPPVTRWQYSGYIFEDDPNDFTQNHQRYSIGAELIGMHGAVADAEIIAMAVEGVIQQKITDWQLTIGHTGLIRRALAPFGLDTRTEYFLLSHLQVLKNPDLGKPYVLEKLDQSLIGSLPGDSVNSTDVAGKSSQQMMDMLLDATRGGASIGGRTHHDIAQRLLQKRRRATERDQIVAALDTLIAWGKVEAPPAEALEAISQMISPEASDSQVLLTELKKTVQLLEGFSISLNQIKIQPDLARFWDYYSGIVFELRAVDGSHLGGGGRYDELSKLLGNQHNVPAVGFAYYVDAFIAALPESSDLREDTITLVVNDASVIAGVHWATLLRQRGLTVELISENNLIAEKKGVVLYANPDETTRLGESVFTLSEFDLLITEFERNHS